MKSAFILIAALLTCSVAHAQTPLAKGNAKKGAKKAAVCASCHGKKGNSQNAQFPKLAGQNAQYVYNQLKAFKSGKRKNAIMKGMASSLSDQDMQDIAAYYSRQKMSVGAANPELVDKGQQLYLGGDPENGIPACAACHSPTGAGNPAAGYPHLAGQHAQYLATQLKAFRSGKRSGTDLAKVMDSVSNQLTDKQIKTVASYLQGLH